MWGHVGDKIRYRWLCARPQQPHSVSNGATAALCQALDMVSLKVKKINLIEKDNILERNTVDFINPLRNQIEWPNTVLSGDRWDTREENMWVYR